MLDQLTQTWEQTQTHLNNQAQTLQKSLNQTTEQTFNSLNATTSNWLENANQALTQVTGTTEQAKSAIAQSIQQANQVQTALTNAIQSILTSQFRTLLRTHPSLQWFVHHPFLTLFLLVIVGAFLAGFFQALSSLIKTFWLKIFSSPFWVLRRLSQGLQNPQKSLTSTHELEALIFDLNPNNFAPPKQEKLLRLLTQLEELRRQQNQVLREINEVINPVFTRKS